MQRTIGFACILAGSMGLGIWYGLQMESRNKNIKTLLRIMDMIKSEIRFGKATLPECCLRISEKVEEPYRSAFLSIYDSLHKNQGESFQNLFRAGMQNCLESISGGRKEMEVFLQCFRNSFEDRDMILTDVERYQEELKRTNQDLEKELKEKKKVSFSLGFMGGLLVILILI